MDRDTALRLITAEDDRARTRHTDMHSYHEGYAVMLEEFDELWDEIKERFPDHDALRRECVQLAAMALRFLEDLC